MKIVILLTIAALTVLADQVIKPPAYSSFINDAMVKAIRDSGAKWEAYEPGENPLRKYTDEQLKYMTSMPGIDYDAYVAELKQNEANLQRFKVPAGINNGAKSGIDNPLKALSVPTNFDWRTTSDGTRCKPAILNQASCGGCYAFATAETFSARLCVASGSSSPTTFSPQDIIACNARTSACNGGILDLSFAYLEDYGIATLACQPYMESNTPDTSNTPSQKCLNNKCSDGSAVVKKFCQKGTSVMLYGKDRIKNEISLRGPVGTFMTVYSDLTSYKGGIYSQSTGTKQGGHAIVLMGWGVEGTTEYWIVQNSWGADWGESGYFRIDVNDKNSAIGGAGYYCVPDTS